MSARPFEGAVTTPEDGGEVRDASIVPEPERPRRPVLIELASAILIVGGMTSTLRTLGYVLGGGPGGLVETLVLGLDALMVLVGILARSGRAWVLAINVVAIALFLEVTALPATFAIVSAALDAVVLVALFRHRSWFDWRPAQASDR